MMKGLALLVVGAGASASALAHCDAQPRHGGVMNDGGAFCFEMVHQRGLVNFHIDDHGQPVPTDNVRGVLVVERDGVQSVTPLHSKKPNIMVAKVKPPLPSDRVGIRIDLSDGSVINGRYWPREPRP